MFDLLTKPDTEEQAITAVEYSCPLCGANCEWFSDCPGYPSGSGGTSVCWVPYDAETSTGKDVSASACGNAALWVCTNLECEWQYRIPNRRGDLKDAVRPDWMHDPWTKFEEM